MATTASLLQLLFVVSCTSWTWW